MNFPILYHKGKTGKVVEWKIWTEGDTIHTEWGQKDGKKQKTAKKAKGKNVGKANETTPAEQACLEAASMHKHKLERKYSLTLDEADEVVFLPMLAHDFRKRGSRVSYPVHTQPKLDGNRCLAYWVEDEDGTDQIELLSRGGKQFDVEHIRTALEGVLPKGFIFDGEIYAHGKTLQEINRRIKKFRDEPDGTAILEFWVYDGFWINRPTEEWRPRSLTLQDVLVKKPEGCCIKTVGVRVATSEAQIIEHMQDYISEGFEGAIIRCFDGVYNLGHRSAKLLKAKPFFDAEYEVTGFYEGVGKYEGCATFICKTEDGKEFHACPKGAIQQKRDYFTNGESYIGKLLTVQYNNLTEDGIPQFPVGLGFRLKEDLPLKKKTKKKTAKKKKKK